MKPSHALAQLKLEADFAASAKPVVPAPMGVVFTMAFQTVMLKMFLSSNAQPFIA